MPALRRALVLRTGGRGSGPTRAPGECLRPLVLPPSVPCRPHQRQSEGKAGARPTPDGCNTKPFAFPPPFPACLLTPPLLYLRVTSPHNRLPADPRSCSGLSEASGVTLPTMQTALTPGLSPSLSQTTLPHTSAHHLICLLVAIAHCWRWPHHFRQSTVNLLLVPSRPLYLSQIHADTPLHLT